MKGPYQIRREKRAEGYHFILWRFEDGKAKKRILEGDHTSPIAPQWMLKAQAKLNTSAVLDRLLI